MSPASFSWQPPPPAARLSERDDACAAVGRRPPPTVLYVRRCGFRRALVGRSARTTFARRLPGSRRPKHFAEVLPRMATGATRPRFVRALRAARGRAWLLERFGTDDGRRVRVPDAGARPGRRSLAIANFGEDTRRGLRLNRKVRRPARRAGPAARRSPSRSRRTPRELLVAPHGVALCRNEIVAARA